MLKIRVMVKLLMLLTHCCAWPRHPAGTEVSVALLERCFILYLKKSEIPNPSLSICTTSDSISKFRPGMVFYCHSHSTALTVNHSGPVTQSRQLASLLASRNLRRELNNLKGFHSRCNAWLLPGGSGFRTAIPCQHPVKFWYFRDCKQGMKVQCRASQ